MCIRLASLKFINEWRFQWCIAQTYSPRAYPGGRNFPIRTRGMAVAVGSPVDEANDRKWALRHCAEYCDRPVCLSVCLSVCPRAYLWNDEPIVPYFVQMPRDRGSVIIRRYCTTLCTSGFMDDVTFGDNGREAGNSWQHSASSINYVRYRGGVCCLWMLVGSAVITRKCVN